MDSPDAPLNLGLLLDDGNTVIASVQHSGEGVALELEEPLGGRVVVRTLAASEVKRHAALDGRQLHAIANWVAEWLGQFTWDYGPDGTIGWNADANIVLMLLVRLQLLGEGFTLRRPIEDDDLTELFELAVTVQRA